MTKYRALIEGRKPHTYRVTSSVHVCALGIGSEISEQKGGAEGRGSVHFLHRYLFVIETVDDNGSLRSDGPSFLEIVLPLDCKVSFPFTVRVKPQCLNPPYKGPPVHIVFPQLDASLF